MHREDSVAWRALDGRGTGGAAAGDGDSKQQEVHYIRN